MVVRVLVICTLHSTIDCMVQYMYFMLVSLHDESLRLVHEYLFLHRAIQVSRDKANLPKVESYFCCNSKRYLEGFKIHN